MKISIFHGRNDHEAYIAWKKKVDFVLDCPNYSKEKKVKLTTVGFIGYALAWWNQLLVSMRHCGEEPISIWQEMKTII